MDIDRFWQLIEAARVAAGPVADQAVQDYDDPDDFWAAELDDLDLDDVDPFDADDDPAADDPAADDPAADDPAADESGDDDLEESDEPEEVDGHEDDLSDPVAVALFEQLVQLPAAEIAAFDNLLDDARAAADRADIANAALLIQHGFLGRDSFDDFRAALVALGREVFEAALANPDSLANHPAVREIATATDLRWLAREDMLFAASHAYATVTGEDEITFFEFAHSLREGELPAPAEAEDWDIEDEAQTRHRLPGLADLFFDELRRNRRPSEDLLGLNP